MKRAWFFDFKSLFLDVAKCDANLPLLLVFKAFWAPETERA